MKTQIPETKCSINKRSIDDSPDGCPDCSGGHTWSKYIEVADERAKLRCMNTDCDTGVYFKSEVCMREMPKSEQVCTQYDCMGSLYLIEQGLYRCEQCGYHAGIAETSRNHLYSTSICPLCKVTAPTKVDYHHWDYEREVGVCICRDCHDEIHDGKRASQQTIEADDGESWKHIAIENAAEIHNENHDRAFVDSIDIYNVPYYYMDYLY